MAETAVKEKANGIPVPEEGTEEFARMNKMAKIAIPIVLIIFTMGVLQQQAFGMIYVNIGDQLGQANLAPLITSIPGIVLGIGRAIGETAVVLYTMGQAINMPFTPLDSGRPMTVHLYLLANDGINMNAAYGTALLLMAIILAFNLFARWLSRKSK